MKLFSKFIAAVAAIVAVAACVPEPEEIKVSGITIDPSTATVNVGESVTLTATVSPTTATDPSVKWTTSDMAVAMVQDGVVRGLAAGTAIISATANDGGGAVGNCVVTVKEGESAGVAVKGVSVSPSSLNLAVGDKETLEASIDPADADNQKVTWSSSKESVATVSSDGQVEAVGEGDAEITVKTDDGGHTAVCKVHVSKEVAEATGLSFEENEYKVAVGKTLSLEVIAEPEGAKLPSLKWSSDDDKIAKVSSKGVVTGKKVGVTRIHVESESDSDISAECEVRVVADPDKLKKLELIEDEVWMTTEEERSIIAVSSDPAGIDPEDLEIEIGEDESGMNPGKKPVEFDFADMSEDGDMMLFYVKPIVPGDCTVTISNADGSVSVDCFVGVRRKPTSFEIDPKSMSLMLGESMYIGYKYKPDKPEYEMGLVCYSEDPEIADVNNEGCVFAPGSYGKTKIHVYPAALPEMEQICEVLVFDGGGAPVNDISLSKSEIRLHEDDTEVVDAFIDPYEAAGSVAWEVDDPDIASIEPSEDNCSCEVTALKVGTTKLHARSLVGNEVDAVCDIIVAGPTNVKSISLPSTLEMGSEDSKNLSVSVNPSGKFKTIEWQYGNEESRTMINLEKMSTKTMVKINALGNIGNAWVRVVVDDYFVAYCEIIIKYRPDGKGHKYIDLNLPSGTLWATECVRDKSAQKVVNYFSWGDPAWGNGYFDIKNYSLWDPGTSKYTKYVNNYTYGARDWLYFLEPEDDPACVLWGGEWVSPSPDDFRELRDYAGWYPYSDRVEIFAMDEYGYPVGDPLVFYYNGYCTYNIIDAGDHGRVCYWTNTLWAGDEDQGNTLYPWYFQCSEVGKGDILKNDVLRYYGMEVRAVIHVPSEMVK